jgi:hypothetical protein
MMFSKTPRLRSKPHSKTRGGLRMACPARACYNPIDSTVPREFRGGAQWRFFTVPTAQGGILMKNPLDSLWGTIISGLVLTVILYFVVKSILGQGI